MEPSPLAGLNPPQRATLEYAPLRAAPLKLLPPHQHPSQVPIDFRRNSFGLASSSSPSSILASATKTTQLDIPRQSSSSSHKTSSRAAQRASQRVPQRVPQRVSQRVCLGGSERVSQRISLGGSEQVSPRVSPRVSRQPIRDRPAKTRGSASIRSLSAQSSSSFLETTRRRDCAEAFEEGVIGQCQRLFIQSRIWWQRLVTESPLLEACLGAVDKAQCSIDEDHGCGERFTERLTDKIHEKISETMVTGRCSKELKPHRGETLPSPVSRIQEMIRDVESFNLQPVISSSSDSESDQDPPPSQQFYEHLIHESLVPVSLVPVSLVPESLLPEHLLYETIGESDMRRRTTASTAEDISTFRVCSHRKSTHKKCSVC